jgi:hypothetical protein
LTRYCCFSTHNKITIGTCGLTLVIGALSLYTGWGRVSQALGFAGVLLFAKRIAGLIFESARRLEDRAPSGTALYQQGLAAALVCQTG